MENLIGNEKSKVKWYGLDKLTDFVKKERYFNILSMQLVIQNNIQDKWEVMVKAKCKSPLKRKGDCGSRHNGYSRNYNMVGVVNEDLSMAIKIVWEKCKEHRERFHDIDFEQYSYLITKDRTGYETFQEWKTYISEENKRRENGEYKVFEEREDDGLTNRERSELHEQKRVEVIEYLKENRGNIN